jgi:hypothetical protein
VKPNDTIEKTETREIDGLVEELELTEFDEIDYYMI